MKTNPNDPAGVGINRNEWGVASEGVTKREYFASMALPSFLPRRSEMMSWDEIEAAAYAATVAADKLIAALNETSTSKQ